MVDLHPNLLALNSLYRMRIIALNANDNRPTTIWRRKAGTRVFQADLSPFPTGTCRGSFYEGKPSNVSQIFHHKPRALAVIYHGICDYGIVPGELESELRFLIWFAGGDADFEKGV